MAGKVALCVVALMAISAVARADGNSGAADAELEFGAITTYATESVAKASCGKDTVVWADRYAGYYYFRREKEYAKTHDGAFACMSDARRSNYWSTGPMGGMAEGHGNGREFPQKFPDPTPTS